MSEGKGIPRTRLELLMARATPKVIARVAELLKLDDVERLALLIAREINPDHVFTEGQEQMIRGVSDKTLKGMKDRSEVPYVLGATVVPLQRPV